LKEIEIQPWISEGTAFEIIRLAITKPLDVLFVGEKQVWPGIMKEGAGRKTRSCRPQVVDRLKWPGPSGKA
jgi:hypothetical protein